MNSDYEKKALISTDTLIWQKSSHKDVFKKILSIKDTEETALIKLDNTSVLTSDSLINSVEIYVLEGTYINEYGEFEQGTYLKLPKEDEALVSSKGSCVIFRKTNHLVKWSR